METTLYTRLTTLLPFQDVTLPDSLQIHPRDIDFFFPPFHWLEEKCPETSSQEPWIFFSFRTTGNLVYYISATYSVSNLYNSVSTSFTTKTISL